MCIHLKVTGGKTGRMGGTVPATPDPGCSGKARSPGELISSSRDGMHHSGRPKGKEQQQWHRHLGRAATPAAAHHTIRELGSSSAGAHTTPGPAGTGNNAAAVPTTPNQPIVAAPVSLKIPEAVEAPAAQAAPPSHPIPPPQQQCPRPRKLQI